MTALERWLALLQELRAELARDDEALVVEGWEVFEEFEAFEERKAA